MTHEWRKYQATNGLPEWDAVIQSGKVTLSLKFESESGTGPAEFLTADPVLQKTIETSDLYKSGSIIRIMPRHAYELPTDNNENRQHRKL